MVSCHMQFMHVKEMRTAKLKRFMAAESFTMETELHRVDCDSSNGFRDNYDFVRAKKEEFAKEPLIPKPLMSGHDLIRDFEVPHGPGIGESSAQSKPNNSKEDFLTKKRPTPS